VADGADAGVGVQLQETRALTAWMMAWSCGDGSSNCSGLDDILNIISSIACLKPPTNAADWWDIFSGNLQENDYHAKVVSN